MAEDEPVMGQIDGNEEAGEGSGEVVAAETREGTERMAGAGVREGEEEEAGAEIRRETGEEEECEEDSHEAVLEEMMEEIMNMMDVQDMKRVKDKEEIKTEIMTIREELLWKMSRSYWILKNMLNKVNNIEKKLDEMKQNEETMKEWWIRQLALERDKRARDEKRMNIVIKGHTLEGRKAMEDEVKEILEWILGRKTEVQKVMEQGRYDNKAIVVQLKKWKDKIDILAMQKHTKFENIIIEDDLTEMERDVQQMIEQKVKRIQMSGKDVRVGYMRYEIDGVSYKWVEEKQKFEIQTDSKEAGKVQERKKTQGGNKNQSNSAEEGRKGRRRRRYKS